VFRSEENLVPLKWSEEEIEILKTHYGKVKSYEIHEKFLPVRKPQSIREKARKLKLKGDTGIGGRKYTFDRHFFSSLGERSCYWAGFIAADGCIHDRDKSVTIRLSSKDRDHLVRFRNDIKYTGSIIDVDPCTNYGRIHSECTVYGAIEWIQDLNNLFNITPRKSKTLVQPNIHNDSYILPYMVGYVDGDGCIWEKRPKYYQLEIVGNESLLLWIKDFVQRITNSTSDVCYVSKDNQFKYRIQGKNLEVLRNLVAHLDVPFLNRKWRL
jgi:hypothetical protein